MADIAFGKRVTESFHEGKKKSEQVVLIEHKAVVDKLQVLDEIMNAVELITTKKTHNLTLIIKADPETHEFKLLTREYVLPQKPQI
ncbi:MAG: hypothetical protein Q8910_01585 [Bacteroidota bacterium]|nr:hypothetical protein [Bacteroidota bacterium]